MPYLSAPLTASASVKVRWLERAYDYIRSYKLYDLPERVEITIGFPARSRAGILNKAKGECHQASILPKKGSYNGEKIGFIIIHPACMVSEETAFAELCHQAIHLLEPGHKGKFPYYMKKLGLEGKPSAPVAGDKNKKLLQDGRMGHNWPKLPLSTPEFQPGKKQGTRLRKYVCEHGQILRAATDSLDVTCNVCETPFKLA